jgi:hypothetical protein
LTTAILSVKEDKVMTLKMQAGVTLVAISLSAGITRAETPLVGDYSHAEVAEMIRAAHTQQQYENLAGYYRGRQQTFEQKAQAEKLERELLGRNAYSHAAKYPRPADALRSDYEQLRHKAQQMSQRAAYYESLSASAGQ